MIITSIRRALLIVTSLAMGAWIIWVTGNLLALLTPHLSTQFIELDRDYAGSWWNPHWILTRPCDDSWQIGNHWYRARDLMGRNL